MHTKKKEELKFTNQIEGLEIREEKAHYQIA